MRRPATQPREAAPGRLRGGDTTSRRRRRLLICALAALTAGAATVGAQAPLARGPRSPALSPRDAVPPEIEGVVVATPDRLGSSGHLAGLFYLLVDPTRELTYEQVSSPAFDRRFALEPAEGVNLGFTSAALWLRIDLDLGGGRSPDWMLTLDYPLLDRIEIWDAARPGDEPLFRLGDRRPFAERPVPHRYFAVPLEADGPERRRLYLRVTTESSMQVRPALVRASALFLAATREELAFGIGYGLMALMVLYNLFFYFEIRDPTYLAYVASTTCGLLFVLALNGHAFQYLWPESPTVANLASPVVSSLWLVATATFGRLFLEPKTFSPGIDRVVVALIGLGIVATLVSFAAPYRPAMELSSAGAALTGTTLLVCGGLIWWRGNRAARFFTLAWAGLGAGVTGLVLSRFGLIPDNDWTRNGALAGAVVEIVLLSLAISDKYRLMAVELESYSKGLEEKVTERTSQLEEANSALQRLSVTDPLTAVANRRRFDEMLAEELARHRRSGAPLTIAMIDIDHFKSFNDRYGHQRGDQCLQQVALAIESAASRASDLVARYGGEEFVVLLPETAAEAAVRIATAMLEGVRRLGLEIEAAGSARPLSISVGLSTRVPSAADSADHLLALADAALYEAKRAGRDRACAAPPA